LLSKVLSRLSMGILAMLAMTVTFYSHTQNDTFDTCPEPKVKASHFERHILDNTQYLLVKDEGDGTYFAQGEQGTRIHIKDALVNQKGKHIRGDIELIEIYSLADMVLHRKQTLADYEVTTEILKSDGGLFIRIFQEGEELSSVGKGSINAYLPAENTGVAKENIEFFSRRGSRCTDHVEAYRYSCGRGKDRRSKWRRWKGVSIGGLDVTFIVIIECPDGTVYDASVTVKINRGDHVQAITCGILQYMSPDEFEAALQELL